jgi:tetraacyldisaccharide 4'-kinase
MTIFELLYYAGYSIKRRLALRRQKRLPHKVISVGNLTLGGTGKTPATVAIAEEALRRGFSPVILTRGYRGKARGPCFVSRGDGPEMSADDAGDEPVLIAERLPRVPVVKSPDRYAGGLFALQHLQPEQPVVFILDDGFQHIALHRDRDVVLLDGSNPFGNGRLFPMGPLREPICGLRRSDVIVVTKSRNENVVRRLVAVAPGVPIHFSRYVTRGLRNAAGGRFPADMLKDKKVLAFCGIAGPDSFRATAAGLCGDVLLFRAFRDHYRYSREIVDELLMQRRKYRCDAMLTTEKDLVKLAELGSLPDLFCVVIGFDVDKAFYDEVFMEEAALGT